MLKLALPLVMVAAALAATPTPVVMWHGMGDSCCNPMSMGRLQKIIEETVPGVYVLSLQIGDSAKEDSMNSFFMDVNKQVDMVCKQLADDPKIKAAGVYNAVGFSQGGQFLRAVAQRCNDSPRMNNLITIGGQHQGVYGLPKCPGDTVQVCDKIRQLLNLGAYIPFVQDNLVQAQYWHDPTNEKKHARKSTFIGDINQDKKVNKEYKKNFMKLNNFVMVKFLKDSMVQPTESQWFGFYEPGDSLKIYNYTQGELYKEDKIGLKTLDEQKRVKLLSIDDDHLRFTDEWFTNEIVKPYFE